MESHPFKNWLIFARLWSSGTSCVLHEFPAVPLLLFQEAP